MKKTLMLLLCLMSVQAFAERDWFVIPRDSLNTLQSRLTYTTAKMDTVWRGEDSASIKLIKQKIVTRYAGGFAVAAEVKVDSTHTLCIVEVYTRSDIMATLAADSGFVLIEKNKADADTVDVQGALATKAQGTTRTSSSGTDSRRAR